MKPILFNTDMVRAILGGQKTETRRPVKPQPTGAHDVFGPSEENDGTFEFFCGGFDGATFCDWITAVKMPCQPGDILYVRETWRKWNFGYSYKADAPWASQWKPSIHMPKEAARIFLRVTSVWAERLQDITSTGVKAEGTAGRFGATRGAFEMLWDSTIKPADIATYGWTANPWVWVIEFERISREEAYAHG